MIFNKVNNISVVCFLPGTLHVGGFFVARLQLQINLWWWNNWILHSLESSFTARPCTSFTLKMSLRGEFPALSTTAPLPFPTWGKKNDFCNNVAQTRKSYFTKTHKRTCNNPVTHHLMSFQQLHKGRIVGRVHVSVVPLTSPKSH